MNGVSDPFKTRLAGRCHHAPEGPVLLPANKEPKMNMVTAFKLYGSDQEAARRFYVDQFGFEVAEDALLGDCRWLLVRAPGNKEVSIILEIAKTNEAKSLVGRQGGGEPLFSISTDDCERDYVEFKRRGVKFDGEP